jgi:hypothetical protein
MTGNLSFGDNDKAIFGAGSDLQIYHDGSNSYVSDQGTGNLRILAEDFRVVNAANSETMIQANVDGDVRLYYDADLKLATTSTGVDITGVLSSDGLTVDGSGTAVTLQSNNNSGTALNTLRFTDTDTSAQVGQELGKIEFYSSDLNSDAVVVSITGKAADASPSGSLLFSTADDTVTLTQRMLIDETGDISFYEDTGTTPKFFWDASAESLGIGTSSPSAKLEVSGPSVSGYGQFVIKSDTVPQMTWYKDTTLEGNAYVDGTKMVLGSITSTPLVLRTVGTERMRIDSSGNVGIGTDSPARKFHVSGSSTLAQFESSTTGLYLELKNSGGNAAYIGSASGSNLVVETGGSERMRIDSSGRVGIGTSSPAISSRLNVSSTTQALDSGGTILASVTDAIAADIGGQIMMGGYYTGTTTAAFGGLAAKKSNATDGNYDAYLQFLVSTNGLGNTEKMRIDTSGNLLVGKTSANATDNGVWINNNGTSWFTQTSDYALGINRKTTDGSIINFAKDGTTVGSIGSRSGLVSTFILDPRTASNGGVGITATGSTSHPALLPTDETGTLTNGTIDLGASGERWDSIYLSSSIILKRAESASVGTFGRNTDGTARTLFTFRSESQDATVGTITVTNSATAYNTSSDYRLKENVTDVTDGITRVKQLAPKRFNFIADPDTTVDGFLAHEVQDVIPEAISGAKDAMRDEEYEVTPAVLDEDGNVVTEAVMGTRSVPDYQGIDQSKLVPLLTAALQEAIAKIETLETRLDALEA